MLEKSVVLPGRLVGITCADPAQKIERAGGVNPPSPPPAPPLPPALDPKERAALEKVVGELGQAASSLHARQDGMLRDLQQLSIKLSVAIASQLLHERLERGDFPLETLVMEAVKRLEPRRPVTVSLHPDDLALLEKHLGELKEKYLETTDIKLAADPSLPRGSCRAQAGEIVVAADLDEQLGQLRRNLLEIVAAAEHRGLGI